MVYHFSHAHSLFFILFLRLIESHCSLFSFLSIFTTIQHPYAHYLIPTGNNHLTVYSLHPLLSGEESSFLGFGLDLIAVVNPLVFPGLCFLFSGKTLLNSLTERRPKRKWKRSKFKIPCLTGLQKENLFWLGIFFSLFFSESKRKFPSFFTIVLQKGSGTALCLPSFSTFFCPKFSRVARRQSYNKKRK